MSCLVLSRRSSLCAFKTWNMLDTQVRRIPAINFQPLSSHQIRQFSYSCYRKKQANFWNDIEWMNHNDSNAEAYSSLDISKLKPFPEFRNVAIGPVWGPKAFDRVWKTYYEEQTAQLRADQQDELWKTFSNENGFTPEEYFQSQDFKERYGDSLIWESYVRNHKGSRQPQRTRLSCNRKGEIHTGSPCPICRDKNILINFKNLSLLHHFIDPHSGKVYHSLRTGVCRKKQVQLEETVHLARDQGLLPSPSVFMEQSSDLYQTGCFAVRPS